MAVRVFKNAWFTRYSKKEKIADGALCEAVRCAENGLIDADLGGGVIKQRIARPGQGKSGGYRALVLFRSDDRAVFAFAFAKNQRENIGEQDLSVLRKAAKTTFDLTTRDLDRLVADHVLEEVMCDDQKVRDRLS